MIGGVDPNGDLPLHHFVVTVGGDAETMMTSNSGAETGRFYTVSAPELYMLLHRFPKISKNVTRSNVLMKRNTYQC